MASAMMDLEEVLKSKYGKLTPEEVSILESWNRNAVFNFISGAITAGTICWAGVSMLCKSFLMKRLYSPTAIRKIILSLQTGFAAEAAFYYGKLKFARSVESGADYILELKGSRIQKELANLLVTQSQIAPWELQIFYKRFFAEQIYDDSTSDHPKLRWRYRNFFSDNIVHGQITHDCDTSDVSYGYSRDDSNDIAHRDSKEASDSERTKVNPRPIFRNPVLDNQMEDAGPLDYLFGYSAPVEDIHPLATSDKPSGVSNHGHKRSHRRRRMRRHEDHEV